MVTRNGQNQIDYRDGAPSQAGVGAPVLRCQDGSVIHLAVDRWHGPPSAADLVVINMVEPPALDVGCGPGRFVALLCERGIPTLGIEPSRVAAQAARDKGARVLQRSIFDRMPSTGLWRTAMLFDENVGIGGDPLRLFRRLGDLLAPSGSVISEVAGPDTLSTKLRVRFENGPKPGPWFDWAVLGVDDVHHVAKSAGMAVRRVWEIEGRWFTQLSRREHPSSASRSGTAPLRRTASATTRSRESRSWSPPPSAAGAVMPVLTPY